jgi:hypothetical protein
MQHQKVVNWFFFIPRPKFAQALPFARFVFDDFVIFSQHHFDFFSFRPLFLFSSFRTLLLISP